LELATIAGTYHQWRRDVGQLRKEVEKRGVLFDPTPTYQDTPGFSKSARLSDIRAHGYVLTPSRYVGAEDVEDDGEPFERRMKRLIATLEEQFAESARREKAIRNNLQSFGYGN
jgi:type I restriction enzyme M protein